MTGDAKGPLVLYIFGGLPGTGKTTLARRLAVERRAVYLRIDTIEAALKRSSLGIHPAQDAGYVAAYALAADNLRCGLHVVADSVNPIEITRAAWRRCAQDAGSPFVEIEVVCSDPATHKKRVEARAADIEGQAVPDWLAVASRHYELWHSASIAIDTAHQSPEDAFVQLCAALDERRAR